MDYFVRTEENAPLQGPLTEPQLRAMLDSGNIPAHAKYWAEGMADWQPVSTFGGATSTSTTSIQLPQEGYRDPRDPGWDSPPPPPDDSSGDTTTGILVLGGMGVGALAVIGLLVWFVMWLFGGPNVLYPIKVDDKWGYIDSSGNVVINPMFDRARIFIGSLAPVRSDEKYGFIDRDGKWVINPQFERAEFFKDGMAPVRVDDKWGYVDESGKLVIPPQFSGAGLFHNGMAMVALNEKIGFIDEDGKYLINPQFEDAVDLGTISLFLDVGDLIPVEKDDKWGYIDETGALVINPQFDNARPFSDGLAAVRLSGEWGYISTDGKYVVNPQFESAEPFTSGLAAVASGDDSWGFIDTTGKFVINPQFKRAEPFLQGLAAVKQGEKWGFIDEDGKFAINPQFTSAEGFFFGELTRVTIDDDYRSAYINMEGKIIWTEPEPKEKPCKHCGRKFKPNDLRTHEFDCSDNPDNDWKK